MIEQDLLRRFLFEGLGVRGEWVMLTKSWRQTKQHQQAPEPARQLLGQALAAVAMLSATIKFSGSMILQAQGDGAIKTLVTQATHDRKVRGLVRMRPETAIGTAGDLTALFGQGQLVLTIEPSSGEPYQGIVGLEGRQLSSALENYFLQSEQLKTRLWLYANDTTAAGLLLQELPAQSHNDEDWERITMLADTLSAAELLTLDCEPMLYRLFHQEKVRLFSAEPIQFECACSRYKIERTLHTLGRPELDGMLKERQQIEVVCEFCGERYQFDRIDIETLLGGRSSNDYPQTLH